LIAAEFASDQDHLGCMLALVRAYREAGHEVLLAASDVNAVKHYFAAAAETITVLQAPILKVIGGSQAPPLSFADLLLSLGYIDPHALATVTNAWLTVLTEAQATQLIYINAPTAVIAARIQGLPVTLVGSAFDIPPAVSPTPAFTATSDASIHALLVHKDALLVEHINQQLQAHQKAPITSLADLFPEAQARLTTLPELDRFGPRTADQYIGPVFALPTVYRVGWNHNSNDTSVPIFVSLHARAPATELILQALQEVPHAETICCMPDCPPEWPSRFNRITFYAQSLELAFLLPKARFVMTDDVTTLTTALLAGVPVLSVPRTQEQHLVAQTLEQTGAGRVITHPSSLDLIKQHITELLQAPHYKQAAIRLAMKYMNVSFENNAKSLSLGVLP
jgi:hypothetical protein